MAIFSSSLRSVDVPRGIAEYLYPKRVQLGRAWRRILALPRWPVNISHRDETRSGVPVTGDKIVDVMWECDLMEPSASGRFKARSTRHVDRHA